MTTQFAEDGFKFFNNLRYLAVVNADTVTFLNIALILIIGKLHRYAYSAMKFI